MMKTTETSLMAYDYASITKQTIQHEADTLLEKITEGEIDPIKAIALLAGIERVIKEVRAKAMEYALDEFDTYGERSITVLDGADVSKVEAGVRYNFKNTEAWQEVRARETEVANERKHLEQTLKTLKAPITSIDPDTGEVITLNPPIKTSTTTLKITIK